MKCCEPHELATLAEQKGVRSYDQSIGSLLDDKCKGRVDFRFRAGMHNVYLHTRARAAFCTSLSSATATGILD